MKKVNLQSGAEVLALYYYAYLDANDVVEMVLSLPSQIQDRNYISIATNDQSLVGKKYNRETGGFEDIMFYYALLDEKDLVLDVVALPSQVTDPKKIEIPTYDKTIVGKWYNRKTGKFEEVPIHILAKLGTGEIHTLKSDGTPEDKWLSTKLNETDAAIETIQQKMNTGKFDGADTYKATFEIEENREYPNTTDIPYTYTFDTGIPGYFPKKIRLVHSDTLVCDIFIIKDDNGNIIDRRMDKVCYGRNNLSSEPRSHWNYCKQLGRNGSVMGQTITAGVSFGDDGGALAFAEEDMTINMHSVNYTEDTFTFKIDGAADLSSTFMTNLKFNVFVY